MSVQSVDRALAILGVVAKEPLGLVDISNRAGLPLTTTSRLLETLAASNAVSRDDEGAYSIGLFVRELAGAPISQPNLQDLALPHIVHLVDELDEAACLSVPAGHETFTVIQHDTTRPVQAQDWTGHRWPMTGGGSGAVMMATWPADRVTSLMAPLGKAQRAAAKARIEAARSAGICWSHGEYIEGLSSVAAPVVDASGEAIGALLSYGPTYRFPAKGQTRRIERTVRAAADELSRQLKNS
ncbi:MAG: DNA-binding IclR family transcriptional regulator [Candidatus Poriferisodalaceae bacterium]|jgi:DNA-binding IclR family transcriptional regulator